MGGREGEHGGWKEKERGGEEDVWEGGGCAECRRDDQQQRTWKKHKTQKTQTDGPPPPLSGVLLIGTHIEITFHNITNTNK